MIRSFYCPISLLERERLLDSRDWRKEIIRELDAVLISDDELRRRFPGIPFLEGESLDSIITNYNKNRQITSFSNYSKIQEGVGFDTEDYFLAQEEIVSQLDELREEFGDRLQHTNAISPESFVNGATCKSLSSEISIKEHGVFEFDDIDDLQVTALQRGWYEDPDPNIENNNFSWKEFLCNPLPPSNSVVITDRYILQAKEYDSQLYLKDGVKQIAEILNCIIPCDFKDIYYVTIVFEHNQLSGNTKWKNPKPITECLKEISINIYNELSYKNIQINYVAIIDPKSVKWHPKKNEWKSLHNHSHDRRVITNYYWILATGALSVSEQLEESKEEKAARFQHVELYTLFRGTENRDQKIASIPFFKINDFLKELTLFIKTAPPAAYMCYTFNSKLKQIKKGDERLIANNLLSF